MSSFLVPAGFGEAELTEKRSHFLARVWHVETETEALSCIERMKKQHYDARHNCFAYALRSGAMRYGDDGEPQVTAGQPILNVFRAGGVTDFCCVVTRYFGGILLGAGGLVRAYSGAAKLALDAAGLARLARWEALELAVPYPLLDRVRRLAETSGAVEESADYGALVTLTLLLPAPDVPRFAAALRELTAAAVEPVPKGERWRGERL